MAFAIIHVLYWVVLFFRLSPKHSVIKQTLQGLISVVVVFKNEQQNLKLLIPKLVSQDYPQFELILCDDFSDDDSFEYVNSIKDDRINAIRAVINKPGKKQALKEAITHAKGKYILVTDADCYPINDQWISSMAKHINEKQILLGYSPHENQSGWLNKFIRYETYFTALQYLSYALAKIPYMGVGRNMLYKRDLFMKSNALESSTELISGDDDIFINAEATGENTNINLDPNSYVFTHPSKTWASFLKQKNRHVTTSTVYKLHHKLLLGLYSLSHLLIYILGFWGLCFGSWQIILFSFIIVLIVKWVIAAKTMKILACKDLIPLFPLLDFMMVCYYIILAPSILFKTKSW